MECRECGEIKELVKNKDICWKCHLQGINFNSRIEARKCKNCRNTQSIIDEHRTSQTITTKRTTTPIE